MFPPVEGAGVEVTREELHFRRIEMRGFRRSDGFYEVEGRIADRKPRDFRPVSGGNPVPADEPVHDMGVRLVYDDQMRVHAVQTFTAAPPVRVTTGTGCPLVAPWRQAPGFV